MAYKCEEELRERAGSLIAVLAKAGIIGEIVPGSARDYLIKVSLAREKQFFGYVNLYYSPTKSQFSMKSHELRDKAILPDLETCWAQLSAPIQDSVAPSPTLTATEIYVDGSYLENHIGYGAVVLQNGNPIAELSGQVNNADLQNMRQVGGEIQAVYEAILWCKEHGVQEVAIYYDYDGLRAWATEDWAAKNSATQTYAASLRTCGILIHWVKVRAHSGDRWNQRADQLAKAGSQKSEDTSKPAVDSLMELASHAQAFAKSLTDLGVAASYRGVVNKQAARVMLVGQSGTVDIYNTPKRALSSPYLHGFLDHALEKRIEVLWQTYLSGNKTEDHIPPADPLAEVTYYYEVLKPYRDCAFDFCSLASALDRASQDLRGSGIDIESSRHDFQTLEAVYFALKGGK